MLLTTICTAPLFWGAVHIFRYVSGPHELCLGDEILIFAMCGKTFYCDQHCKLYVKPLLSRKDVW